MYVNDHALLILQMRCYPDHCSIMMLSGLAWPITECFIIAIIIIAIMLKYDAQWPRQGVHISSSTTGSFFENVRQDCSGSPLAEAGKSAWVELQSAC